MQLRTNTAYIQAANDNNSFQMNTLAKAAHTRATSFAVAQHSFLLKDRVSYLLKIYDLLKDRVTYLLKIRCDITAHTVLLYVLFCLIYMYCTLYVLYILYTLYTL